MKAGIHLCVFFSCFAAILPAAAADSLSVTVTNLNPLQEVVNAQRGLECGVRLEVSVCAASRPEVGAVIGRDETGVELLELGGGELPTLQAGDKIRVEGARCWLRRRETGVEISAVPVVANDGVHGAVKGSGQVVLSAGFHRFQLDWFNGDFAPALEVTCKGPQMPWQKTPAAVWWHGDIGGTNQLPGLLVKLYEGKWEAVPDFNWLGAVRTAGVTNIGLELYPQRDRVGLRFSGWFAAPREGRYTFRLRSANGALLFVGNTDPLVQVSGHETSPPAAAAIAGQIMEDQGEGPWVAVEGRVVFITKTGQGLELELRSGNGVVRVKVADAIGVDATKLLNARLRAQGVGKSIVTFENKLILERLLVASSSELEILEAAPSMNSPPALITTAEQVQLLRPEDAARHLPVRIRGVVTSAIGGLTLQDDTRGVYVNWRGLTNQPSPVGGEMWEVTGRTQPGDFAPVISAEKLEFLGAGQLPDPAHPTWNQLINGSMDVQWVEMQAGLRPFLARLPAQETAPPALRAGSLLELTGVYASLQPQGEPGRGLDSFEVLLEAPGAIRVLSQPPWWTLQRSLMAVGALSLLLSLVALWVLQLRRQVNLQTRIIRGKAEREARLEERTRIARDLHDDLGASLTEITVLASTSLAHRSDPAQKTPDYFRSICDKSRQLVAALDAIVWAIDPQKNTLQSLADYMVDKWLRWTGPQRRLRCGPAILIE